MSSKRLGSPTGKASRDTKKARSEIPSIDAAGYTSDITSQIRTMPKEYQESSDLAKKPAIDVPGTKSFCGIANIAPETGISPSQTETLITTPATDTTNDAETAGNEGTPKYHNPAYHVWVAMELFHPGEECEAAKQAMVKILGIFNDLEAALEHAEEHKCALYTRTTDGFRTEEEEKKNERKLSADLSPNSLLKRQLQLFRECWKGEDEEEREDGGKKWIVKWACNITEVWVEKREVYESVQDAGFHIPLPLLGFDDRDR